MKLLSFSPPPSLSHHTPPLFFTSLPRISEPISRKPAGGYVYRQNFIFSLRKSGTRMFTQVEERSTQEPVTGEWGKVSAVLFDMDGVLCDSEEPSRLAAVELFAKMGVEVTAEDFVPFMGTGEANFLGGVAAVKGVKGFDPEAAKKRFFEIYLDKYAKPNSGIGFPGALELISQCKSKGLKVAVASSADRIKVNANLAAAGLPLSIFDAIISADKFENLKPAPDIFLSASKILNVPTYECIVIEDALAGIQAAKSAGMRCIALTTTLSEEALKAAGPSFIRKEIQNVSIDDILSGGSINEKAIEPQYLETFSQSSLPEPTEQADNVSEQENHANNGNVSSVSCIATAYPRITRVGGGLTYVYAMLSLQLLAKRSFPRHERIIRFQGSRRDLLRYGSLGVAISCFAFFIANWKAMQYTSPKALWNSLFGGSNPSFDKNDDGSQNLRIQQFVRYISDIESKGTAPLVPEFPSKLDWLNTAPLMFSRDLKGKVVVLDFWTYCCINCMHVLPDLEFLEKKYKDMPFTVVGVHSAKFDNEKDSDAIRNAVLRYGITHPVVNDGDMYLWRELGVSSWPTFAIISPNGKLLAQLAGEGRRKDLDDLVEAAFLYYGEKKELDNSPLPLRLEKDNDPRLSTSPLKFPGKLAIDILNNRLFISDSNHNRIVATDLDGNFVIQIGSTGQEGLRDGSFDEATFNRPQGLAYNSKKNLLYIADTENHALRVIDFVNETVRTVAGNGTKGLDYEGGGTGMNQLLNSPWDVCFEPVSEKVYIAMAGQHQIWEHDTSNGVTKAFSGNGYERNLNGSGPTNTSFAQPSGISLSGDYKEAYIADSESSSIRALDLITGGSRLLAGGDPLFSENLFRFGDHDGKRSDVLLQHPLGVLYAKNGLVYIADSYNHKIKKLDLGSNEVTTIAGTGKAGFLDGSPFKAQLSEPSGMVEGENGRLYIADTNNSLIRYLDLNKEDAKLLTLELNGVKPPVARPKTPKRLRSRTSADTLSIKVDGVSTNQGKLTLAISVPEGYHFSKEARSKFFVESEPDGAVSFSPAEGNLDEQGSSIILFKRSSNSSSTGRILCKVYYCKEDEVCLYQSLVFKVPFLEKTGSAAAERTLSYVVKPRSPPSGLQLTALP